MALNDQNEHFIVIGTWGLLAAISTPICQPLGTHIMVGIIGLPLGRLTCFYIIKMNNV